MKGLGRIETLAHLRDAVVTSLARLARDLTRGVSIRPFYDQSVLILKSPDHLQVSMLEGALLIVLSLQPVAASYALEGRRREPRRNPLDEPLSHGYRRLLEKALRRKRKVEAILRSFPEVVSVERMTGSAEGSEHAHPVNHSHYSIALVPRGTSR